MKIYSFLVCALCAVSAISESCAEEINMVSDDFIYENKESENNDSTESLSPDDYKILTRLAKGDVSKSLTIVDVKLFQNDARTDFEWEEVDLTDYAGFSISLPYTIQISEGYTWSEYSLFDVTMGPNPLYMPWKIYCSKTGHSDQLFIISNMGYDEENQQLTIGDKSCHVESLEGDCITLSYESPYYYHSGDTSATGTDKQLIKYKLGDLSIEDKDSVLYFKSERELFRTLIDTLREYFGNEFNMNKYLYPKITLDSPMVNFDEIEKELLGKQSNNNIKRYLINFDRLQTKGGHN